MGIMAFILFIFDKKKSNKQYNKPVVKTSITNTFFCRYYIRMILRTRRPPQSKIRCVATALVKGAKPNRVIQFKCGKVRTHAKS